MSRPVLVAISSDQHTGSYLGLCPSEGVRLDEGGYYHPSKAQRWLWECWEDAHQKIGALRKREKAKLIYVSNGDAVDGDHHGTSQIITRNVESQAYIRDRVFSVIEALKPDEAHIVRGTTTHVGEGAAAEEALGRRLEAEKDPDTDAWSSWHVRLKVHGRSLDFQHHCSLGGLPWTRPGGVTRLAFRHWCERELAGFAPADIIVRSHVHVDYDSYDIFPTRALVTPAWQLKTSHAHKVATESIAKVGMYAILIQPDGEYDVKKYRYTPALPTERVVKP